MTFVAALAEMEVPDREERESEDYGEERPTTKRGIRRADGGCRRKLGPRPSASPRTSFPSAPKKSKRPRRPVAKKVKRAPRFVEETEEDMEEIDYSGRIH